MSLTYRAAVEQTITAGEQIHQIVNGTATTEVTIEDGSKVPSIRKALLDNFYFKDPIAWQTGQTESVFNQLRQFTDGSWWYAPNATAATPISMGLTPIGDVNWVLYSLDATVKLTPQIREALRRSYAASGFTLVQGSFEDGATITDTSDVVLQQNTGRCFNWQGVLPSGGKVIPAGSTPASTGGIGVNKWRDVSEIGFVQLGSGTDNRNFQDKMRDVVSIKDFSPYSASDSNDNTVFVPNGVFPLSAAAGSAISASYYGNGRLETADGNKRGKWFSNVTSAPASIGNHASIDTAFNGDLSKSFFQIEHRVSGSSTLGQPTSGYVYTPEVMPNYTYMFNSSGWNNSTSGNGGRTGVCAYRAKVDQYGQGDAVAFNASVFVTGTKAGSTHWLANPAGVMFNGDMTAEADGVYFNPREMHLDDAGFDVAAVGDVVNMRRTNNTGNKSTVWTAARYQSIGTKPVDNILSATGKFATGIDLSMSSLDFGVNKAAISLKSGDRLYLNNAAVASGNLDADWKTTVFNGDYIEHSTGAVKIVAGGNAGIQVSPTRVIASLPFVVASSTPVVAAGQVGIGASTSTTASAGAISKPSSYAGYLTVNIGGSYFRIPYYNV